MAKKKRRSIANFKGSLMCDPYEWEEHIQGPNCKRCGRATHGNFVKRWSGAVLCRPCAKKGA